MTPAAATLGLSLCAKAAFRMGCHGPRTEHDKCRNSDPFRHDMGLLQQVTLIPGVFTGLEDFSLDLQ